MTDATKRGRPCYGFLAQGQQERSFGTCSTCDLPAAAHQRIVFFSVTLPPLVAGTEQVRPGAWSFPFVRSADFWRPATLVTCGLERSTLGRSVFVGFQQATYPELGAVYLLPERDAAPEVAPYAFRSILARWASAATAQGHRLSLDDLDVPAFLNALRAAHETLELEAKVDGRGRP